MQIQRGPLASYVNEMKTIDMAFPALQVERRYQSYHDEIKLYETYQLG